MSYWGENDTSISFCENKYSEIYWIAEYYNTCSSFLYILAALPFLRGRIKKIGWSCVGVGVGSMMLHGSMRYYGQWVDEISMLLFSYNTLRYIDFRFPPIPHFILFIYLNQSHHFYVFFTLFSCMQLKIFYILRQRHLMGTYLYSFFFSIGFIFWILDQWMCSYVQTYQLHAFWHLFTSLSMFTSMSLLQN